MTLALRAGLFLKDGEVNGRVSQRKWFPNIKGQMKTTSELRDGLDLRWGYQSQEKSKDTILFSFIFEKKKKASGCRNTTYGQEVAPKKVQT